MKIEKKFLKAVLLPILFVPCCSIKKNITVYDKIVNEYCCAYKRYNDYFWNTGKHLELIVEPNKTIYTTIAQYNGNINNKIFAISFFGNGPFFDSHPIKIGDYSSELVYPANYLPYIFSSGKLYTVEDALKFEIVDVDFIKSFDSFSSNHNVDELKSIIYKEGDLKRNNQEIINATQKSVGDLIREAKSSLFPDIQGDISDDYVITNYLGRKDDCFAVVIKRFDYACYSCTLDNIRFENYVSLTYYHVDYFPLIFDKGTFYSLKEAVKTNMIDITFIKSFDLFQKKYSPNELNNVYLD